MSWQDFVDKGLLERNVVHEAAILGLDGSVWAQSAGCNITDAEQAAIIQGLEERALREICIGGRKYRCTMATLDMIWGEDTRGGGKWGCIIKKTNSAVIVAEYPPRSCFGEVLEGVEVLGDYLIRKGY